MIEIEKPRIERVEASDSYGKFVVEPLEHGFGQTLGNSLRRVLLSSLPGVAVSSIRIEGIQHEFSAVPGVKEDVAEIILNLKELSAKLYCDGPKTVSINVKGPCELDGGGPRRGRSDRGGQPRSAYRHAQRGRRPHHAPDPGKGPRLCERSEQQKSQYAHRRHPDGFDLHADPQGELHRREHPRRPGDRLRSPDPRGVDRRQHPAG